MTDTIRAGAERVVLTASYTMSDGTTRPADDATWTVADPLGSAITDASSGAAVTVTGADHADGSTDAVVLTVEGQGFTATAEVDVAASAPPVATSIVIQSSGTEAA